MTTSTATSPSPRASLTVDITVAYAGGFRLRASEVFAPGITCLLGPSGAGKSSLLAAIAGIIAPHQGSIALGATTWFADGRAGAPAVNLPIERRQLAFVFQKLALFPHLTGLANVRYGLAGLPRQAQDAIAMRWLTKLGVEHLAHRKPPSFSGGEAQRVALARALAISPTIMLFDEPFSSLDFELRVTLAQLVKQVAKDIGVPTLFVTHSTGEAEALADRTLYVRDGALSDTPPQPASRMRRPTPFPA